MSHSRVLVLAVVAGCQGKSEPDLPRPPIQLIEARATGGGPTVARIRPGHPCRAEVEGDELIVGTQPLVAQVGKHRWSGEATDHGATLRRDEIAIVQVRDLPDTSVELLDPYGAAMLRVAADGSVANARGEIVRRVEPSPDGLTIGASVVTGTSDVVLGVLITAPELIPEVRALTACRRLSGSRSESGAARK